MFFYLPLESYRERYTYLMSSENGWMEQRFKELGVDFYRVSGKTLSNTKFVETGIVLDYFGRAYYSLLQNAEVVRLIKEGVIKDGDILYYEDFWTPGMEAVQYAAELAGIKLDIYAMLHAQTVDKYDFTVKLKKWMRHYEIGQSKFMKGIFVSSEYLQDLCTEAGLDNVFKVGLPYNKDFILQNFLNESIKKKNQVIFSSRFDEEKNPLFFVEFAKYCKQQGEDFEFIFTSSAKEFKSNSEYIKRKMIEAEKEGIIKIKTNLTKKEYYEELQKSKYQFNSAYQDWLSFTLLEAITFKCIPIYPKYRAFPEHLPGKYLYKFKDVLDAYRVFKEQTKFDDKLIEVVNYSDQALERQFNIMRRQGSKL